jgi:multicomponent Na+:H+ antiporter subunit B
MHSLLLRTTVRVTVPLLLIFSLYVMLRGHNAPGGGFVGGLVAAAAFGLIALSEGYREARKVLRFPPRVVQGSGLLAAAVAAVLPWLFGKPFLTGLWWEPHLPGGKVLHLGSPVLFDIGVYLVVIGSVLRMLFDLESVEREVQ